MDLTELPDSAEPIAKMVCSIAKSLVSNPDAVTVSYADDHEHSEKVVLCLRVEARDLARVIGREGRTARSLRTIVGAAGMKAKRRYDLCICEQGENAAIPGKVPGASA